MSYVGFTRLASTYAAGEHVCLSREVPHDVVFIGVLYGRKVAPPTSSDVDGSLFRPSSLLKLPGYKATSEAPWYWRS
jgi:hypothetical protein